MSEPKDTNEAACAGRAWIAELGTDICAELRSHWPEQDDPELADEDKCCWLLGMRAAAEIDRLRALAKDAYEAWSDDKDARVGKLLRTMLDEKFSRAYRPDLVPNAQGNKPPTSGD